MKIAINKIIFEFSLFSIIVYLLFLIMLISLGFWQLDRAEQKRVFLEKQQVSKMKVDLKSIALIGEDITNIRFRTIEVSGSYDLQHQYLIDNQIVNGHVGYYVLTPLLVEGLNKAILVNRGWVALNKDRRILPDVSITQLNTTVKGRVNTFPSVGIRLAGAEIPTDTWPSVVQVVDTDVLSNKLGYSLFPFQVELHADMNEGYVREWKKNTIMPPEKHIAYAIQWFGLAFTLTVLVLWLSNKK